MAQRKITIKQTIKCTVRQEQRVKYQQPTVVHGVYAYSTAEHSIDDICQALKLRLEKLPV